MTNNDDIDQLANALSNIPSDRWATIKRDARLNLRLSVLEKDSIKATAKHCRLTVTEYLLRLHAVAAQSIVSTPAAPPRADAAPGPATPGLPLAILPEGSGKPRRPGPATVSRMPANKRDMRRDWETFFALIEKGHLIKDACIEMGLHATTATKWRRYPEYVDRLTEARAKAKANKR